MAEIKSGSRRRRLVRNEIVGQPCGGGVMFGALISGFLKGPPCFSWWKGSAVAGCVGCAVDRVDEQRAFSPPLRRTAWVRGQGG